MAKGQRRRPGRQKKAPAPGPAARQPAARQPDPAPRARGRPAKAREPPQTRQDAREAPAPRGAAGRAEAKRISKRLLKQPATPQRAPAAEARRRAPATPPEPASPPASPLPPRAETPREASPRVDAAEAESRPRETTAPQPLVSVLADLRERVDGGQKELLGRTRAVLGAVEATATRMSLYGVELTAIKRRLEEVDESLKALTRGLQQPCKPQESLAELHRQLHSQAASPRLAGAKIRKARKQDSAAQSAADSGRRSADKPAKVPGKRGRRSHAAAEADRAPEPEHPNLYNAEREAREWPGEEVREEPQEEPRVETAELFKSEPLLLPPTPTPTPAAQPEASLCAESTALASPQPAELPQPPAPALDAQLQPKLEPRAELDFAEEQPRRVESEAPPKTLFSNAAEKRDFF